MARDRANIRVDLWADEDWRALSMGAQHLYQLILTHPTLNYAGVADWRPGRLAALTRGRTVDDVLGDAAELSAAAFVFADDSTEEVLVRSFARHDGVVKHPRLHVTMANDFAGIASSAIKEFFAFEIQKLHSEQPDLALWGHPKVRTILKAKASDMKAVCRGLRQEQDKDYGSALAKPLAKDLNSVSMRTATATATSSKEDTSSSEISDEIPRPDVEELLDLLDSCLEANGSKRPSRNKKNRDAARLLLDRDGYDVKQVSWMIRWATSDEFWRGNILSMSKLREKFDQLKAKAGVGAKAPAAGFHGEIDVDAVLGRDVWQPGTPPEGLDVAGEIAWKKEQRALHNAERLAEAKRKLGVAA
ncbi:hypothetical protein G9E11_01960 [Arthrobacter sp. IA7]|uniref:hypothetical protein n=1 Tax=Arthrobacter ipis TaxID=2716202 RepID=UPI001686E438|nr:hypothetical protein [Arthrobacter ipis]MBD1541039.1 hypothetical protein [Arthrobacter ipis]